MIEGDTSFVEVRDKATECGEAPYNSLYPLYILNRAHPHDGRDLFWVGFDAALRVDKTQQHTSAWAFFYRKPKTEPNRTETEPNSR